ncbi:hypothetical protein L4G92_05140 [Neisseria sp. ZJ106]|uniref:Pilus assembly protein PilW n=1 Tax=Neisseria lisongii TaxID=2912188 RepID=A0ABY7RKZ8_9NEIS|nr:hypothetical protein [Neisseria lisongii]MCF7521434.1 hypothetical protein [Neisseria lisongii]WCL72315.1 hypothetical protein PJU73_04230 [Neisseria lisongii]
MKSNSPPLRHHIQGFSLMEFLIAGLLAVLVLLAIQSVYANSRRLHQAATARLAVQQDIRHTAALITRDARMAGSFGCFNMAAAHADTVTADSAADHAAFSLRSDKQAWLQPIKALSANLLNADGFHASGTVLLFRYGSDTPSENADIFSSCTSLVRPSGKPQQIHKLLNISAAESGEISALRYTVHAYAVGSADGQNGLFRLSMQNGGWSRPELLIADINSWQIQYLYADYSDCSAPVFRHSSTLQNGTPQALTIVLNRNSLTSPDGHRFYLPDITAHIRGANQCTADAV